MQRPIAPLLAITIACGFVLAGCGSKDSQPATSGSESQQVLKLGAVLSMTGVGGVYGPVQRDGIELARDVLNEQAGGDGIRVEVSVADDGSEPAQAAQQFQQLIQREQVHAVIGPTLSNSAPAAHPIAASSRVPALAISTTGEGIVGPGCDYCKDGWIFRNSLGEATAIPANIETYVNENPQAKTGVLIYPNDDKFSADGAAIVRRAAPGSGIKIVESIEFRKDDPDLSPFVTKAVQTKADVMFITSLGAIPPKIMRTARSQGFEGQFLGGNGFNLPAESEQAGKAGDGAQSAAAYFIDNDFTANARFVEAYRAKFNKEPDQFSAQAYSAVLTLVEAAKRAQMGFDDPAGDREKLRAALEGVQLDTPLGPFSFTPEHDVLQTIWIQAMDGNGGFELVDSVEPEGS